MLGWSNSFVPRWGNRGPEKGQDVLQHRGQDLPAESTSSMGKGQFYFLSMPPGPVASWWVSHVSGGSGKSPGGRGPVEGGELDLGLPWCGFVAALMTSGLRSGRSPGEVLGRCPPPMAGLAVVSRAPVFRGRCKAACGAAGRGTGSPGAARHPFRGEPATPLLKSSGSLVGQGGPC